ncbi:MAG: geranylgeranylglycerol-phosphate geranylgeranyltransferase [Candidatus Bathyarchaeota archaeon]|nr:MAG: geranylgeranylglycerol-phosphate geranylgeranyltransferase [Candidatus Bathyarchaeota archaeon]
MNKIDVTVTKMVAYLRLTRPINCLMMGFAVIVGTVLATSIFLEAPLLTLIYVFVTGFTLTAASMAINDYYDREIDAVNEPNRPIPSGLIKPEEALAFAFICTIIGFVTAYLTNLPCFITAIASWTVSVAYATVGKRTGLPGNFLVSACVAVPFIYGSLAVANKIELNVLFFASMAFLSNTGREITKGIVDVQGDRARSIQTLAVLYGEKTAAVAASFFYLSAVLLSPIPWLLDLVSLWFIPLVAITDFGLVASSLMLMKKYSRENARKTKKNVLLWFIIGLLAFVIGAAR